MTFLQNPPQATAHTRGMPAYGIPAQEAAELSAFLRWVSDIDTNGWPPEPLRPLRRAVPAEMPQISSAHSAGKQLFAAHGCVACHSIGSGARVGPDLGQAGARYDREALVQWIHDPDAVYKQRGHKPVNAGFATMASLGVSRNDAEAIAAFLLAAAGKE